MAQAHSAGLTTAWGSATAGLAVRVRVDWNRDGDYVDTYEDVTDRVLSISIDHSLYDKLAGLPMLGVVSPAKASVVLSNETRWFSPSNASGLAGTYTSIADGYYRYPIRIEMGYIVSGAPEYLVQFQGEIEGAVESETMGQARISFTCIDNSINLLQYKASTQVFEDQRPDQGIDTLLTAVGAGGDDLDQAMAVIPFTWMDDENGWEECMDLAASEGGMFYYTKDGTATFRRMTSPIERTYSRTSQATLDESYIRAYQDTLDWRDCYSEVIVRWAGRYAGTLDQLYRAPKAIIIPPGATVTEECRLRHPVLSAVTPIFGTDYSAVSSSYETVAYGATGLELTATTYAQRMDLAFKNNLATDTVYVTDLVIRGFPLLGDEAQEQHYEQDPVLGKVPGDKVYTIRANPYMQDRLQVLRLGQYLRDRLQVPQRMFVWQGPACPWLEVLDRVTLSHHTMSPNPGVDEDCYVLGIQQALSARSMWSMQLLLLPVSNLFKRSDYFLIGTTQYGTSGRAGY